MNMKKILISVILIYMFFLTGCISVKYHNIEKFTSELKFSYNNISVSVEEIKCNDIVIIQDYQAITGKKKVEFYLEIYNNDDSEVSVYLHNLKAYEQETLEEYEINDVFPLISIDSNSKKDIYISFLVEKDIIENKYIFEFSIDNNRVIFHLYESKK